VGKGTHFGVKRLVHHIRSCSDNFTRECYILKLDIEGYFMNIDRRILYDLVVSKLSVKPDARLLDARLLDAGLLDAVLPDADSVLTEWLVRSIIFNDPTAGCRIKGSRSDWDGLPPSKSLFHSPPGCGLAIGNLTSQLFSNIYLSELDRYVTRTLRFRHYGRYVDDFYLLSEDKTELLSAIPRIRLFLSERLHLTLHPRKIYLQECRKGVKFLGCFIKPYGTVRNRCSSIRMRKHVNEVLTDCENPYVIDAVLKSCGNY